MEKTTNHSHSTELSTTVFLWVTAKGLSCLIWATAEIFLRHPNSSLPPSMLPNHPTEHQTTDTSHCLLSPVSNRVVNDASYCGFLCLQSHTQPLLGKQNTDQVRATNTVHDLSAWSQHLYMPETRVRVGQTCLIPEANTFLPLGGCKHQCDTGFHSMDSNLACLDAWTTNENASGHKT